MLLLRITQLSVRAQTSYINAISSLISFRPITSSSVLQTGLRSRKEERYRNKDKVPIDYRIIYRAPMEYYLSACSFITSFSFVAFGGITAYAYSHDYHTMPVPFNIEYGPLTANEQDLLLFLGFFLLANVAIRIIVNRYPLRIYRNNGNYLAIFEGTLPFTRKSMKFIKGDVSQVPEGGILPWQDARYTINKKQVLLFDNHFRTPSELNAMMTKNR
ncbi:uncharacterized protein LOC131436261 isoform X2 [Malaya genurostris]|uniref:uncharacterized protein LOC131436261 isoform X2 n=1 Tax=Malaya genurostris TaxID=325434 RepID=UPI0026F4037D|nr:uncharacterized protein LOC131436261 isoform X2 [Malaya genurostris]